jgi:hypothetical protein
MFRNNYRTEFMQITEEENTQSIFNIILEKTKSIDYFTQLFNSAPDFFTRRLLDSMLENNRDDLELYKNLYMQNYGEIPKLTYELPGTISYKAAILTAMDSVINSIDTARKFLLSGEDQLGSELVKATLILDIENLSKLGIIYNSLTST